MATNLLYMHHGYHGCGPISGLHFNAAVKKPPVKQHSEAVRAPDGTALDGLIASALDIATRNAAIRRELKDALVRDDLAQALRSACALAAVEPSGSILALILSRAKAVA